MAGKHQNRYDLTVGHRHITISLLTCIMNCCEVLCLLFTFPVSSLNYH